MTTAHRRPTVRWLLCWAVATVMLTGTAYLVVSDRAAAGCSTDLCFADLAGLLGAGIVLVVCVMTWLADAVRRARRRPLS